MDVEKLFEALAQQHEFRSAQFDSLDIAKTSSGYHFEGHACTFDDPADLGFATESIARGAFRKVLQQPDNVPFTLEHDDTKVLATTRSGTLRLSEDAKGLRVEADVPDTSLARDLVTQVKAGIIHGMSFGFKLGSKKNQTFEYRNGKPHRRILGFHKLVDVCATWNPTYLDAEAQFRSLHLANSPLAVQQFLLGAYPQLGEGEPPAEPVDEDEEVPAVPDPDPDGAHPDSGGEGDDSGAVEQRSLSVAARRRRLSLFLHEHGGGLDDAS